MMANNGCNIALSTETATLQSAVTLMAGRQPVLKLYEEKIHTRAVMGGGGGPRNGTAGRMKMQGVAQVLSRVLLVFF